MSTNSLTGSQQSSDTTNVEVYSTNYNSVSVSNVICNNVVLSFLSLGVSTLDVTDTATVNTLTANSIAGTLTTNNQPNINSLGNLSALQVDDVCINDRALYWGTDTDYNGRLYINETGDAYIDASSTTIANDLHVSNDIYAGTATFDTLYVNGSLNAQDIYMGASYVIYSNYEPLLSRMALGNSVLSSNLTSVGNLTSLNVVGNAAVGNLAASGNITAGNLTTTGNVNASYLNGNINLSNPVITGNVNCNSGTLFVDSTNNRVGIGNTTPGRTLDISGDFRSTGGAYLSQQGNTYVEIVAGTDVSYIDMHSKSSSANDYDVRLIATGGSTSAGAGTLNVHAGSMTINNALNVTENIQLTNGKALHWGGGTEKIRIGYGATQTSGSSSTYFSPYIRSYPWADMVLSGSTYYFYIYSSDMFPSGSEQVGGKLLVFIKNMGGACFSLREYSVVKFAGSPTSSYTSLLHETTANMTVTMTGVADNLYFTSSVSGKYCYIYIGAA